MRRAFDTDLHRYRVGGQERFANVRDAAVPAQIEPLVYTLKGLDDLQQEPRLRDKPRINGDDGSHAVTPGDLAVIYNLAPLWKKGFNGAGQRIVVTGQSAFNLQDVRDFRDAAGLPPSEPKVILMPGSRDPGFSNSLSEALLDVQYAGGGAPGASILYVYGTNATLAAQYAVDQNLAPVISESFGECEKSDRNWLWHRNVAQQAAAQGITWVVSSGDTGPAGCESQLRDSAGASGISMNLPASVPEVTAIGGTTFVEGNGKYWAPKQAEDGTSALSYIPEKGWNDGRPGRTLASSGGGISAAFPRPSWQSGPGLPNDNARHVPDLAFTASGDHDPYLIIKTGTVVETGGTSAGTPFFAGMLAALNQYVVASGIQARPGLGNINPRLYQLAQTTRGVFHDITTGDNIIPCKIGTPDCTTGQYGYRAGPGYDHVTGLGSVDAVNLFENWAVTKSTPKTASTVVLSVEPSPVYQQAPDADGFAWFYTIEISETGADPTTVTGFSVDGYDLSDAIVDWFGTAQLAAGGSLSLDMRARGLDVPSDHVFAIAGVDASGQKWAKQVTVPFLGARPDTRGAMTLASDPAVVTKLGKGDTTCAADHPYGQKLILRETSGGDVKLTKFLAGGYDYSDRIASWFGSQKPPAKGTLQAKLCWQMNSVPATLAYEMDGVDGSGRAVQATLNVQFRGSVLDEKSGGPTPQPAPLSDWPGGRERHRVATPRQLRGSRSDRAFLRGRHPRRCRSSPNARRRVRWIFL